MANVRRSSRRLGILVLSVSVLLFGQLAFAAGLPGSVLPERASRNLAVQPEETPKALPPLPAKPQQKAQNALGEAATTIKFKLVRLVLEGNHVYSNDQLQPVYKKKLNTEITVAELQTIVQDITNYYRNNGYILTRAILPPQHVAEGVVKVQVIEGYIDHVAVVGIPKGSKDLVQAYGDKIAQSKPVQIKTMEHYLLLANEIPGVQVKAVLEPSKNKLGASDLNLVAQSKTTSAYVSYDNYGTRYIGPTEVSGGVESDSVFRAGDSTQANFSVASKPQELKFLQLTHSTPLGSEGTRLVISANQSLTRPGYVLTPEIIDGVSDTFSTMVQYPLVRSRSQNMTLDAGLNYIDSSVVTLRESIPLYTDHLRTLRFGASYDLADSWQGSNSLKVHAERGLGFFGATSTQEGNTPNRTSRFGGSGTFNKMDFQFSRLQQFGSSRFSAFLMLTGQYALEPLLASEQFSFGGASQGLGRGYDPAEIIGDKGFAGSLELRMNVAPGKFYLQAAQLYVFYDAGVVWNNKDIVSQGTKFSATSAGAGSRFFFTKNFSGNLMIAQPITKQVSALQFIGDGRQPRIFFSLTASV